jgi:flagellar hook-basal body complex protein FliE
MTIPPISSVSSVMPPSVTPPVSAPTDGGNSFSSMLTGALNSVQSTQATSDQLAVQAVTGDLTDIHAATIAATRASVTLQVVSAVRNQGVEAFNDIMKMTA